MSVNIGRIMGIPIRIHYTLWFVFLLISWSLAGAYMPQEYPGLSVTIYWAIGISSAIILFASILLHELSHSYIAKKNGLPISRITLFFFGGVSEMTEEPQNPSLEVRMALAGPLMSFFIAAILGILWYIGHIIQAPIPITAILRYSSFINAILGGFNLLPAFPVDGGRVLRGGIWFRINNFLRATIIATKVSEVLSFSMIGLGLVIIIFGNFVEGLWIAFIGWFIKSGAETSLSQTLMSEALSDIAVEDIMTKKVITIPPDISVEKLVSDYFLTNKHEGYPVVKNGQILGMVTLQCVRPIPKHKWRDMLIKEAMVPCEQITMVKPTVSALNAMHKMARENVRSVIVVDEGKIVGILTRGDLMRIIRARSLDLENSK